jgi:hypothetical protein
VLPLDQERLLRWLCFSQGAYFAVTGIWPQVSIRTFEAVTGPKVDRWLVKTVGVLVAVIGVMLLRLSRRAQIEPVLRAAPEVPLVAIGSAAGLMVIDVVYVAKGRIAPIYLLDALLEAALIGGWTLALWRRRER